MWRGHSYPRTIANSLKQFAGGSAHSAVRYILYMPKSSRSTAKARVLSSREVYRGPVFWVTSDEVIEPAGVRVRRDIVRHSGSVVIDRKSTRLNSSHRTISYAVFCLKK